MAHLQKKSEISVVQVLLICIVLAIIVITYILILSKFQGLSIQTQSQDFTLTKNKIFNVCFQSKGKYILDISQITQQNLQNCLSEEFIEKGKSLKLIFTHKNKENTLIINEEHFKRNEIFCGILSKKTIYCGFDTIPFLIRDKGNTTYSYFTIQEISQ